MRTDARTLRPYLPLIVCAATVAAGWTIAIRPISADRQQTASRLATLRQREVALRREVSGPSPRGLDGDPAATFERQLASSPASPALLEHLARLAEAAHARNLLIETVEASAAQAGPAAGLARATGAGARDPRIALFDVPVADAPIRIAFDTDYASLGRFLWALRNLPTVVEIRGLSIGLPTPEPGSDAAPRTDLLRASLTLLAYARPAPPVVLASNAVAR